MERSIFRKVSGAAVLSTGVQSNVESEVLNSWAEGLDSAEAPRGERPDSGSLPAGLDPPGATGDFLRGQVTFDARGSLTGGDDDEQADQVLAVVQIRKAMLFEAAVEALEGGLGDVVLHFISLV